MRDTVKCFLRNHGALHCAHAHTQTHTHTGKILNEWKSRYWEANVIPNNKAVQRVKAQEASQQTHRGKGQDSNAPTLVKAG